MSRQLVGNGLSGCAEIAAAVREACSQALAPLAGARVTLAAVFATPSHWLDSDDLATLVASELNPEHVIGSMTEAVIGCGRELERGPGISVLAAHLPDAIVSTHHLRLAPTSDQGAIVGNLPPARGTRAALPAIVLSDPFSMDGKRLIGDLGGAGYACVGGLSSGGQTPGVHRLLIDGRAVSEGAVVAVIDGVAARTVVSQGCAPIGPEMVITNATDGVVRSLAGRPAVERLQNVIAELSPAEQTLAANGLLAGIVIDENRPQYGLGDYLIRPVLGASRASGEIVIGERVRVGQTFRFHVRDAVSAEADLRRLLQACRSDSPPLAGGLIFNCNGRGRHMFSDPDHDVSLAEAILGPVPIAGMFCNGEIGPVGQDNFLHGFTATMLLFEGRANR